MKIVLIVGLPCSGKTTYIKEHFSNTNAIILDDFGVQKEADTNALVQALQDANSDIVISDVHLCKTEVREKALKFIKDHAKGEAEIEWIFFENDMKKCMKNLESRNAKGDLRNVIPTIKLYSAVYEIPEGVVPLEIVCS